MRPSRLAGLVTLLAAVACGGSVVKVGPSGGGGSSGGDTCPTPTAVGAGGSCSEASGACPGTVTVSTCSDTTTTATVQCTCDGGSWSCPVSEPPCPPPAECPEPQAISPLGACSLPNTMSCTSDIPVLECDGVTEDGYELCNCVSGQWQCAQGAPACPADAGSLCPAPAQVLTGGACEPPQAICPGNPQVCGSQTFYDELQCIDGAWQPLVETVCDVDASADAEGVDGGQGI